jgi:ABC-type glycerol-3-phosphate transport system substrate-binding protein
VQTVVQTLPSGNVTNDATAYLDSVQKFVSLADVVLVRSNDVSPEATRTGYYLNLEPLVASDTSLNASDFYPNMLRAFQWDNGMWALPVSADVTILTYDPSAFDAAGLNYPTGQWTLKDLINAASKLTVKDSAGNITTPGLELFQGNNDIALYMSLLGKQLVDPNAVPNAPAINQPEVQTLLDALPDLYAVVPAQANTFGQSPIQIGSIRTLVFRNPNQQNGVQRKGTLLPGGHAYVDVSGVAVSGATQYPEAAYKLAKFLTTRTDIATQGRAYPARQSLSSAAVSGQGGGPGGRGGGGFGGAATPLTPELQKLYTDAFANALTNTDRRYFNYLNVAVRNVRQDPKQAGTALADMQALAVKNQQLALDRKTDSSKLAVVATPVPALAPGAGIVLKFGVSANGPQGNINNREAIQTLANQFVKDNPGLVGRIDIYPIEGGGAAGLTSATEKYDAFYVPYSVVSSISLDTVLPLNAFLDVDSSYNAADFVGGTLNQVTRDNKIRALPMGIQPTVMWYDPVSFANAGLTKPSAGWDVAAFADDLKGLLPVVKSGVQPFAAQADLGSSLLMLMSSYGGLPIDFRNSPLTVDFTSQANVDAMRQVLDLARNGYISYSELGRTFGFFARGGNTDNPVYSELLNGFNFRPGRNPNNPNATDTTNFVPVTYPKGTKTQLVAYSVGTLYVSASAQNADAAYKWIKTLSMHPEIFRLMPARHSLLDNASLVTNFGEPLANTYRDIGKVLDSPNTITAPTIVGGFGNLQGQAVQHWLYQAWDNYVLKGKPLDTELAQAQTYATGFLQCSAGVPAYDPKAQQYRDYLNAILDCAKKVDPTVTNL